MFTYFLLLLHTEFWQIWPEPGSQIAATVLLHIHCCQILLFDFHTVAASSSRWTHASCRLVTSAACTWCYIGRGNVLLDTRGDSLITDVYMQMLKQATRREMAQQIFSHAEEAEGSKRKTVRSSAVRLLYQMSTSCSYGAKL